jgi:hypothetical protein
MIAPFRILISYALQVVIGTAAPVGICLHAYSPEAPAEKIECFEFEKVERTGADYRFFPRAGKSVMVTAYRFRGAILYKPDLAPTHPEFDKQLKLYENTARATPSTRAFLNPKILAMRSQSAAVANQAESVAALPAITLADGSKLVGCTVSKIEGGFVSVRHQNGVSKISLKELDATEKKALNSTTDEWSLDDPSVTPKDSTGTFAKIVLKNGRLLNKAKFKEVSKGDLIFIADEKGVSVPADQFPGELSVLGDEVAKVFSPKNTESASTPPQAAAISSSRDMTREEIEYALRSYNFLGCISEPSRKDELIKKLLQLTNQEFAKKHPAVEIYHGKDRLGSYLREVYSNAKKAEVRLGNLELSDFDALQQIQIDTIISGATLAVISKNISIDVNGSYGMTISSLNRYLFTLGNMAGYAVTSGVLSEKKDATAYGVMRIKMLNAEYKSAQERLPFFRSRFEDKIKENFPE